MTIDEIIKLAREADPFGEHGRLYQVAASTPETLARFAALVRNAVLEEAAAVCETGWKLGLGGQYQGDVFAAAIRAMKEQP